jgi:hypothetical protein
MQGKRAVQAGYKTPKNVLGDWRRTAAEDSAEA